MFRTKLKKCGQPNHWEEGDPNQGGCHLLVSKMTPMCLFLLYDLKPIQGLTKMLTKNQELKGVQRKYKTAFWQSTKLHSCIDQGQWVDKTSIWIGGAFGFMAVHD